MSRNWLPTSVPCRDSLDRWLPGISGRGSSIRQLARSSAAGSHSYSSIVGAVESGSWSVPAATGSSCSSARTPVAGPRLTNLLSCRGRLTVATAAGTFRTLDETSRLSPLGQSPRDGCSSKRAAPGRALASQTERQEAHDEARKALVRLSVHPIAPRCLAAEDGLLAHVGSFGSADADPNGWFSGGGMRGVGPGLSSPTCCRRR